MEQCTAISEQLGAIYYALQWIGAILFVAGFILAFKY